MEMEKSSDTTYIVQPNFRNKFKPKQVKELMKTILQQELKDEVYDSEKTAKLTRDISKLIKDRLTREDIGYNRYKFIIQVVIGEQKGAGVRVGCRCLWDEDTDRVASEIFTNDSLFCIATCFGVYLY